VGEGKGGVSFTKHKKKQYWTPYERVSLQTVEEEAEVGKEEEIPKRAAKDDRTSLGLL